MKTFKSIIYASIFAFISIIFIASCSDNDDPVIPQTGNVKATYRIVGSSGVNITSIVFYENNTIATRSGNFGAEWTSHEVENDGIHTMINATASGPSDQSTLKAQILIDGKVVKESPVSQGKILVTSLSLY
ncbi:MULTISPECIES: hypothetical protein [Sphingobacterium]|uniref:Uncharacterized protein n=1 Tax=Sphingobacterium hotanense TaxID=649196 RepID=A0ABT7NNJ3_9SPHI|nr:MULTISPECIES: hypothetical protein [Sphingobacterium]MDM1048676.1 hypothetical protein [Sphingobacterium hotanense]